MKDIRPNFDDLNDPNSWKGNDDQNRKELEARKFKPENLFPVDAFPKLIQEIILGTNECLKFPIDFIGLSILFTISVTVGNTFRILVKKGWTEIAVIYAILVGPPGTNKSHPLSFALKPLQDADTMEYKRYTDSKKEFDKIMAMSKSDRKSAGVEEPEEPVWKQNLISDSTPEALTHAHKLNPRGIGVYHDEAASWTKNFNRYNSGSEEQFWLSNWSGKPITINRKTAGNTHIPCPFIDVIGTIQPGILKDFASSNRVNNGFLDRILYAFPRLLKKEYWSEKDMDQHLIDRWYQIVRKLLNIALTVNSDGYIEPTILKFSPEAKDLLFKWQRELTDQSNESGDDEEKAIYSKIEMYVPRLSLILELAKYGCTEARCNLPTSVSVESVEGAIKLVDYFKQTALMVRDIVSNTDPLAGLSEQKKTLYQLLPEDFTTAEGVDLADSMNILKERAAKKFFQDKQLFKRIKHGKYEKLL
jgi:hypothetical protein